MTNFRSAASIIRSGFTLVELLIVMGIIVLLASIALPTVKELLKDQKSSQAARLVQAYAESARARAIATGRPVAMVIERMYSDDRNGDLVGNDCSTRLSIGEVFPPYEGDWSGAQAIIRGDPGSGIFRGTMHADISFSQAASLWDSANSMPSGLVNSGDIIMFGDSRRAFRIADNTNDADVEAVALDSTDPNDLKIRIDFDNPPFDEDAGLVLGEPAVFPAALTRFRIFRKPSKSMAGSIVLPRGICIDLAASGVGPSGLDFGTETIAASTRVGDSDSLGHVAASYGPVYIVFDQSGKVQDLYYGLTPNVPTSLTTRRPASNTIHLLVGKTEQVEPLSSAYLGPEIIPPFDGAATRDDVRYNLLDPSGYWVSVNPYSGAITTSQVQDQSAFPPLASNLSAGERLSLRVARSRALASSGTQRVNP